MTKTDNARVLRASGMTYAMIGRSLGMSAMHAFRLAGDVELGARVAPSDRTVVRHFPHNGGCSSTSGMVPISLPRISALHGAYEERAAA